MNKLSLLVCLLALRASFLVQAQTNYVVNTPNSITPANFNTLIGAGAGQVTTTGLIILFWALTPARRTRRVLLMPL
ncbi:hypothetical protein [Spirosoma telluris]|uniref:hypothetical protein n=1 Tax=Spirosoma telluris TaxID=2183553 RepID=UPI002FC28FFA